MLNCSTLTVYFVLFYRDLTLSLSVLIVLADSVFLSFSPFPLFVPLLLSAFTVGKRPFRKSGWGHTQTQCAHTHTQWWGGYALKPVFKKHSRRQNTWSTCRSVTTSNKLLPRHVVVLKTLSAFTNTTSLYECPNLHQMNSMWEGSF